MPIRPLNPSPAWKRLLERNREALLTRGSELSTDFRQFNFEVGMPYSDLLKAPVFELSPHQLAIGNYDGKDLFVNKANKVGATWTVLRDMALRGTVGDCVGYNMLLVSSDGTLAQENLRRLEVMFQTSKLLSRYVRSDEDYKVKSFTLTVGTRYIAIPAEPAAARSWERVKYIFADEAAHIRRLNDSEYVGAWKGRLANTEGYWRAVSTPKGQRGFFYNLSELARKGLAPIKYMELNYLVGIGTFFTQEWVDEQKKILGPLWEQEFECKFLQTASAAIPAELITEAEKDYEPDDLDAI